MIIPIPTVIRGYHIQLKVEELKDGTMAVLRRNDYLRSVPKPSWVLYDLPPATWGQFRFLFKHGKYKELLELVESQKVLKQERQRAKRKRVSKDNPKARRARHKTKKKFQRPADSKEFIEKRKKFLKTLGLSSEKKTTFSLTKQAKTQKLSRVYLVDEDIIDRVKEKKTGRNLLLKN